jgi:hypothetical protein
MENGNTGSLMQQVFPFSICHNILSLSWEVSPQKVAESAYTVVPSHKFVSENISDIITAFCLPYLPWPPWAKCHTEMMQIVKVSKAAIFAAQHSQQALPMKIRLYWSQTLHRQG